MGTSILAMVGALTIMYFAIRIEEDIMQVLTGKGVIEQLADYLNTRVD